jgi:hypothetical protein
MAWMLKWTLGRAEEHNAGAVFHRESDKKKKEEFPGLMENMLPGNSFPQICVVSVNKFVEKANFLQEYGGTVAESNTSFYS